MKVSDSERNIINDFTAKYGDKAAKLLESMSHKEWEDFVAPFISIKI